MNRIFRIIPVFLIFLLLAACSSQQSISPDEINAAVQQALAQTQTAVPAAIAKTPTPHAGPFLVLPPTAEAAAPEATPQVTRTARPTATFTPTPVCGARWSRLVIGANTSVLTNNGVYNRVRAEPSLSARITGGLAPGAVVKVVDGPVCADGYVFWQVESPLISGGVGWTAEGDGKEYYLTSGQLLFTTETELVSDVKLEGSRYVFSVLADRPMPEPRQLRSAGRIDFVWFVDADMNRASGQSEQGNDYNIHLWVNEVTWGADIYPVSGAALSKVVEQKYGEIAYKVDGLYAELSFPAAMFPAGNFRWRFEAGPINASEAWKEKMKFSVSLPERTFTKN